MTRLERMEIQQTKCPTWILLGYNVFKGAWGGDISPWPETHWGFCWGIIDE